MRKTQLRIASIHCDFNDIFHLRGPSEISFPPNFELSFQTYKYPAPTHIYVHVHACTWSMVMSLRDMRCNSHSLFKTFQNSNHCLISSSPGKISEYNNAIESMGALDGKYEPCFAWSNLHPHLVHVSYLFPPLYAPYPYCTSPILHNASQTSLKQPHISSSYITLHHHT